VYRFFAPKGGEFDYDAYTRGFETGERKPISPKDALDRANHRVAAAVYRNAAEKVGPSPSAEGRAWLRHIRDALVDEYPGYEPVPRDMGATDRAIRQLEDAVADKRLANTDTGKAIATYFLARKKVNDQAARAGLASATQAKSARPLRDWLRAVALGLTEETPSFAEVWESVLERELADDAEEIG
jgi:hypothetical protein